MEGWQLFKEPHSCFPPSGNVSIRQGAPLWKHRELLDLSDGLSRAGLCLSSLLHPMGWILLDSADFPGKMRVHHFCHKTAEMQRKYKPGK